MKIVFIGAVTFSEKTLEKLIALKADIAGVCTLKKSSFNADHVDLTQLCMKHLKQSLTLWKTGFFGQPNVFVDISLYIDDKIEVMKNYASEMGEFPFPRSEKTLRALAILRGSQSGFDSAEAFELVYERKE